MLSSSKLDVIFAVCIAPIIIYAGYNEFSDLSGEIEISSESSNEICVICENKAVTDRSSTIAIEISLISLGISITLIFKKKNNDQSRSASKQGDSGDSGSDADGSEKIKRLENIIIELRASINQLISDQKNNTDGIGMIKTEIDNIKNDHNEIRKNEKIEELDNKVTQLLNRFDGVILNQTKYSDEIATVNNKIDELKVENDKIKNQLKRIRDSKDGMAGVAGMR